MDFENVWACNSEHIESIEPLIDSEYNADDENGWENNYCWSAPETQKPSDDNLDNESVSEDLDNAFFLPSVGVMFQRPQFAIEEQKLGYRADNDVLLPGVGIVVYRPWGDLDPEPESETEPEPEPEPACMVVSSSMSIDRGEESPIFCPVPTHDWKPQHADLDWWQTWVFTMDDSESENGDEDRDEERLINRALRLVDIECGNEAADNPTNSQSHIRESEVDDSNSNLIFLTIDGSKSGNGDETVNQSNSNWVFTMDDSDSGSDYSDQPSASPASPALTDASECWYLEGNPFLDPIAYIPMFEELDVEGLIREPGFTFEDNDDLRIAAGTITELDPHRPWDLCFCQWCRMYRAGGNQEPHDATIWCSCEPCVRVRGTANPGIEEMETEEDDEEPEDVVMTDAPDSASQFEEIYHSRSELFETIKDQLRARSP